MVRMREVSLSSIAGTLKHYRKRINRDPEKGGAMSEKACRAILALFWTITCVAYWFEKK